MAIRILCYGGHTVWKDNSAFEFAAKNVQADYKNDMKIERFFLENGAKQLVQYINSQQNDSIQSLDIFCHGNPNGLYFHLGAKIDKDTSGNYSNL